MHVPTTIRTAALLRDQYRPGFVEPFDMVIFTIEQDGIDGLGITVWVHTAYPPDRTEAIGRSFLVGRLTEMTVTAAQNAMTAAEVDDLWQTLDPATRKGRPT
ncbi:hypothetical protein ACQKJ1_25060 [Methylorubrum rhodesianum]|uniref:hypothetical protein n=1 Tax=Methylorubrum rhodesianum TaxID=29427 RepID=UPI003D078991